ncbi:MAG: ornithine cyclodeaminase [Sediminicola sp.]|jgi:ornithine cyclodeaminase
MVTIINLKDIKFIIKNVDVVSAMEEGFIQYSNGNTVVPPVGELLFEKPKGDAHIKYGYIKNDDYYVIKIASGFYDNAKLGIPSGQGLMLLFDQKTGVPKAVLLDEGYLTDIRTAAAGALAAKYFAPKNIKAIGIIGTGMQAKLQLQYLLKDTPSHRVWVWGRNNMSVEKFVNEFKTGFDIRIADSLSELAKNCNLIVTTTPSEIPLLKANDIQKGTHITAVGSDTQHKQELESAILKKADIVISDSIPQSKSRGEIFRAVKDGVIMEDTIIELGTAIQDLRLQRKNDDQITVVDLTGVAVQDIMIAKAVYTNYIKK